MKKKILILNLVLFSYINCQIQDVRNDKIQSLIKVEGQKEKELYFKQQNGLGSIEKKASKGAIIEAVFILQNRQINIEEFLNNAKMDLKQADLLENELNKKECNLLVKVLEEIEKIPSSLFRPFYNKLFFNIFYEFNGIFENDFSDILICFKKLKLIEFIKFIYPLHIKELIFFINQINDNVIFLEQQSENSIFEKDLKSIVNRANLMEDIVRLQDDMIILFIQIMEQEFKFLQFYQMFKINFKSLQMLQNKYASSKSYLLEAQISNTEEKVERYKELAQFTYLDLADKKCKFQIKRNYLNEFMNLLYTNKNFTSHENFFIKYVDSFLNTQKLMEGVK